MVKSKTLLLYIRLLAVANFDDLAFLKFKAVLRKYKVRGENKSIDGSLM